MLNCGSLTFIKVYHHQTSVGTTGRLHSLTFIKGDHHQTSVGTTGRLHSLTLIKVYQGLL
jgi:surface antigen